MSQNTSRNRFLVGTKPFPQESLINDDGQFLLDEHWQEVLAADFNGNIPILKARRHYERHETLPLDHTYSFDQ